MSILVAAQKATISAVKAYAANGTHIPAVATPLRNCGVEISLSRTCELLMKSLYDVLNVRADDDAESVKRAFRKAVKANHPDLNAGDPDRSVAVAQILRANATLHDPELRAIYDRMLEFEGQQSRP